MQAKKTISMSMVIGSLALAVLFYYTSGYLLGTSNTVYNRWVGFFAFLLGAYSMPFLGLLWQWIKKRRKK